MEEKAEEEVKAELELEGGCRRIAKKETKEGGKKGED